jgi:AcrR family transcriptional regulator
MSLAVVNATAQPPKRQRGRVRVAAIMEAGIEVLTEKGYDGATMTEIAARSGTAIGSLYRFFPSKESLADALLAQYAEQTMGRLDEFGKQAATMTLDGVADAFVDFMLVLQAQRSFALALISGLKRSDEKRLQFRHAMRAGMAMILRKAMPALDEAKSDVMSIVLLQILKGMATAIEERPDARYPMIAEMRVLVRTYLASPQPSAALRD